jgi:hypothetical protein
MPDPSLPPELTEDEYDAWAAQERGLVNAYLEREGIASPNVEWPAFDVAPHFAIWAVESKLAPGSVGWWAFSGDCPTDHVSDDGHSHPRNALRLLLEKWRAYVPALKAGQQPRGVSFGDGADLALLGTSLERRISLLTEWLEDDGLWVDP